MRLRRHFGADDYRIAEVLSGQATIELALGHATAALDLARQADAMNQRTLGTSRADPLRTAANDPRAAVAPLARAHELATADADQARALWVASLLARARFDSGDRDAGRQLAIDTQRLMTADDRLDSYRTDLEAWMRRRAIAPARAK